VGMTYFYEKKNITIQAEAKKFKHFKKLGCIACMIETQQGSGVSCISKFKDGTIDEQEEEKSRVLPRPL
jgi:hypothetical protein